CSGYCAYWCHPWSQTPPSRMCTLALHDALPISLERALGVAARIVVRRSTHNRDQQRNLVHVELGQRFAEVEAARQAEAVHRASRSEEHTSELQSRENLVCPRLRET